MKRWVCSPLGLSRWKQRWVENKAFPPNLGTNGTRPLGAFLVLPEKMYFLYLAALFELLYSGLYGSQEQSAVRARVKRQGCKILIIILIVILIKNG